MLDINFLDHVLQQTLEALEKGQEEIFDIAENARQERDRVRRELEEIQKQTLATIKEVDSLESLERGARRRLMEVSRNFQKYREEDMQRAYEEARELQIRLGLMRERENQLRLRRDELQFSLKRLEDTVERAENLVSQVGVVLRYLGTNLHGLSEQLEEVHQRQQLGYRIIKAQEEERKRVAREIHDGPAQSMANVVLRAEICEKLLDLSPERVRGELRELKEMVKLSLQDVRQIIFDLRPMLLDDLGLVPAIKRYLQEVEVKHRMRVELVVGGQQQRLSGVIEVALFRVLQEGLNNVRQHSGVHQAVVRLEFLPSSVCLTVEDHGRGFQQSQAENNREKESYGLMGMRERVELFEGSLEVWSKPGEGTRVVANVPLAAGGGEG